jgi:hypothetical protein
MYESPIKIIEDINRDVTDAFEDHVYKCVLRYGIDVDREELIQALNYDRQMYEKGYADGYKAGLESAEIIRCRDCEYYHPYYCEKWSKFGTIHTPEDGYCHMAERRENER